MLNLAVFVSGSGSDMQCLIDAIDKKELDAKIVLVVASKPDIYALERAKAANIPCVVFQKSDFDSVEFMYDILAGTLEFYGVDLIVLAGYLSILTKNFVDLYQKRIINIHPSLIPKYCGKNFYGMKVHEAVISNKENISGATVHYVDEGTDTGEIILQESVMVYPDDTPQTLQKRVLELEHSLLPRAVKIVIDNLNKEKI
ncbi:phosphoribosylglycinamide formyltransferase [bacterium]|nr:phosphoribosylglycinamide formyltransferase [bacterium]